MITMTNMKKSSTRSMSIGLFKTKLFSIAQLQLIQLSPARSFFQAVDFYNHQSLLESTIFTTANYIEILAFVAGPRGFCWNGSAYCRCWICRGVCDLYESGKSTCCGVLHCTSMRVHTYTVYIYIIMYIYIHMYT